MKKVERGLAPAELQEFEQQLVQRAQEGYTADQLLAHLRLAPGYAWPEGNGPRDDDQAAQAQVTKRVLDNGLTRWVLDLDALIERVLPDRARCEHDHAARVPRHGGRALTSTRRTGVR